MLRNRLLPLQHATALQLQHWPTRAKSSNISGNVTRQSKIFGKLFGNRLAGSKKRWYPSNDANSTGGYQPSTVSFQTSQFGKSGSQAPGSKHNTRRMAVLNKLFMTHITDQLATGLAAESILGRGLQVSRVKISSDFNCINVYWQGTGQLQSDSLLETELQRCSGQLRHELSQLQLMGEVPRIKFVRDKTGSNINHVESILRELDLSTATDETEEHRFDVAQTVRQEFYGNAVVPTSPQAVEAIESTTAALPEMRHDVLGLNHRLIMEKILTKMRRSKQAWDQHQQNQQLQASTVDMQTQSDNALKRVQRKLTEATESASKFDAFLAKRRERKHTPERKKHRNELEDWPMDAADASYDELELMSAEQRQLHNQDDFIVEEEKTHSLK